MKWVQANPNILARWDALVDMSLNATLFHRRRFLAYHGSRFRGEECFLVALQGDQPVALLPLSIFVSDNGKVARSPYGGSYGGIAFLRNSTYSEVNRIVGSLVEWLSRNDIERCVITQAPDAFHNRHLATIRFCHYEHGFRTISREVSSLVHTERGLDIRARMNGNARNMGRKAKKAGIVIEARSSLDDFWPLVESTYQRHRTRPTHEESEMRDLLDRCPQEIRLTVARLNGHPVAGVAEFRITNFVNSSFYLCQNAAGSEAQALSLLVIYAIERAQAENYGLYDFGTSTAQMQARPNIFRFKESFGAQGVFRETIEWVRDV